MELPEGLTVEELLTRLGVRREYTAVALNRDVTPKRQYADAVLARATGWRSSVPWAAADDGPIERVMRRHAGCRSRATYFVMKQEGRHVRHVIVPRRQRVQVASHRRYREISVVREHARGDRSLGRRDRHRGRAPREPSRQGESLLDYVDTKRYTLLPNTAGCYTADEAVRTATWPARRGSATLVKLEVIGDSRTLFPDALGLLEATRTLAREGFRCCPTRTTIR